MANRIHLNLIEIKDIKRDLIIQLNTGNGIISMKFKDEEEKSKWHRNLKRAMHN